MNIVFLTLSYIESLENRSIYMDLLRHFRKEGHEVYVVCPNERRTGRKTEIKEEPHTHILGVKVLNIQKTQLIEKGIGTMLLEFQYTKAIKKYFSNVAFDLIIYTTPPITLAGPVCYLKKQNPKAISYLLLKDIFPQNAVDLGMMSKGGLIFKFFRRKEKKLYKAADYIGCLSPANIDYLRKQDPWITPDILEVNTNSIELEKLEPIDKKAIREKYKLPQDKLIFVYGGNLGIPQGVDFIIKCLEANINREDVYFLIVGDGTEYGKIKSWIDRTSPTNIRLHSRLPKHEYEAMARCCDVGLIFLDFRFLIPNFPCRILDYLKYKMPVLSATDTHTDVGSIAENNGFGKACLSNDVDAFTKHINYFVENKENIEIMGNTGHEFLINNYLVSQSYEKIMSHIADYNRGNN